MISVIIPTLNTPTALDLCLKSAIDGQQQQNEIIVVVDGDFNIKISCFTCSNIFF